MELIFDSDLQNKNCLIAIFAARKALQLVTAYSYMHAAVITNVITKVIR